MRSGRCDPGATADANSCWLSAMSASRLLPAIVIPLSVKRAGLGKKCMWRERCARRLGSADGKGG